MRRVTKVTTHAKKILGNRSVTAIAFSFLFIVSGIGMSVLVNPAAAAPNSASPSAAALATASTPLQQAQANWASPNGNAFNQDYNPQNQINASNAQYLGLSWIFPIPQRPTGLLSYNGAGGLGVDASLLVVNGTIYAITVYDQVFALGAATGIVLWSDLLPIALNSTFGTSSPLALHSHDGTVQFTTATFGSRVHGPTLWFQAADNRVYAIDALSGKYDLNFTDFTGPSMLQGNSPTDVYYGVGVSNILIDQADGIMITSHQAEVNANNGRCYFMGWNLDVYPPSPLWTSYCSPPQAGSALGTDPNWTISQVNSMSSAEIFDPAKTAANGYTTPQEIAGGVLMNTNDNIVLQLKSLSSSQLNATLYNDWGQAFQSSQCLAIDGGSSTGSTGSGWGGAWLLGSGPTAGLAFLNTNNKDPYSGPCDPGPDLWAASLLAINVKTGAWVWGFQANPHDIEDWDCSWWQALGNETIGGVNTQVIFKTCKNGYLYEINAKTGGLIWAWGPTSDLLPRCSVCYNLNPLNRTQMTADFATALTSGKDPLGPQPPFLRYPGTETEEEQAYDPNLNLIFIASANSPSFITYVGWNSSDYTLAYQGYVSTPVTHVGTCGNCGPSRNNATIWAVDAATGAAIWHYSIQNQGYRGGLTASGGMVFLTLSSGDLLMLNAKTGQVVKDFYIGGPLNELPSIGQTADGKELVVFPIVAGIVSWATGVPGDIVALSLQSIPSSSVTTLTAAGSTATTTSVSTITTTVVNTVAAGSNTTTYALAGVAAIFIIATGYLAFRGRKPLS
jgi:glucose dehydrogenase